MQLINTKIVLTFKSKRALVIERKRFEFAIQERVYFAHGDPLSLDTEGKGPVRWERARGIRNLSNTAVPEGAQRDRKIILLFKLLM